MGGASWLRRAWSRLLRGDPSRWSDEELGRAGERAAARLLRGDGEVLLAARFASSCAEIDLLSRDRRGRLWLHEVKTTREPPVPARQARSRGASGPRRGSASNGREALSPPPGARKSESSCGACASTRRETSSPSTKTSRPRGAHDLASMG
jgi:hypothetical protein